MENKDKTKAEKRMSDKSRAFIEALLCSLFYILVCVYIPVACFMPIGEILSGALALGVCIIGIAVLAIIAHSFHAILTYALIIGIFILFGGMLLPIGLFSAFASASCIYAFLITKKKAPFVWGLPLIPLIVSLLLFNSAPAIFLSIATLPCSLFLAHSAKKQLGRVSAVCRISAGICISVIILLSCGVYSAYGDISIANIKEIIENAKEQLSVFLNSATTQVGSLVGLDLSAADVKNVIELTISSLFNLLPAIIITIANIAAYVIHSLFLSVAYTTDEERKQALPMLSFDMSIYSAILYILSLILAFVLTSDSTAIYGTAAENLLLILAPGLILTALAGIRAFNARKGPSCFGTIIYFIVIFMLVSLSPFAIIGVSLAGAILIILAHIARRRSEKKNNA